MLVEQYDIFEATFRPLREDDLQNDAEKVIGVKWLWQAGWIVDKGYLYAGNWAMNPYPLISSSPFNFAWVPFCDLENPVLVRKFGEGVKDYVAELG